ncbi:LuxR C-terminal-related transcriptional regulator [Kluyvera sp. NPDC087067]|uniref:LuxR C-terminal-related transcriptional regulator n=1 Tax=Kluyvera sp. NPDC087067 TaxID=3364105 RepID=UPI0038202DCB
MLPVRTGNIDFWIDDSFLQLGLERTIHKSRAVDPDIRLVFFTIDQYNMVKKQRYSSTEHRLILLTEGHMYNFLDDAGIYRMQKKSSFTEMEKIIENATQRRGKAAKAEFQGIVLSERDKTLLNYFCEGKKINEIAELMQLHFKTIYLIRKNLINKLGCSGVIDFLHTLRKDVFKTWLMQTPSQMN